MEQIARTKVSLCREADSLGEKNGGRHGAPGEAPWIARYRKAQGEPSTKEGGGEE